MFLSASLLAIGIGVFCFYNRDIAWAMFEFDRRFWSRTVPQKGKYWAHNVRYASLCLIMLGLIGIVVNLQMM